MPTAEVNELGRHYIVISRTADDGERRYERRGPGAAPFTCRTAEVGLGVEVDEAALAEWTRRD
jgi:hypothetical protein